MNITNETIKARIEEVKWDLHDELKAAGRNVSATYVADTVTKLNTRMRVTAGRAHYRNRTVEIAAQVFSNPENWPKIDNTIRHEFAHILAFEIEGHKGHGRAWKKWATICGCDGTRCHSMNVARNKMTVEPGTGVSGICEACGQTFEFRYGTKRAKILEGRVIGGYITHGCTRGARIVKDL